MRIYRTTWTEGEVKMADFRSLKRAKLKANELAEKGIEAKISTGDTLADEDFFHPREKKKAGRSKAKTIADEIREERENYWAQFKDKIIEHIRYNLVKGEEYVIMCVNAKQFVTNNVTKGCSGWPSLWDKSIKEWLVGLGFKLVPHRGENWGSEYRHIGVTI